MPKSCSVVRSLYVFRSHSILCGGGLNLSTCRGQCFVSDTISNALFALLSTSANAWNLISGFSSGAGDASPNEIVPYSKYGCLKNTIGSYVASLVN